MLWKLVKERVRPSTTGWQNSCLIIVRVLVPSLMYHPVNFSSNKDFEQFDLMRPSTKEYICDIQASRAKATSWQTGEGSLHDSWCSSDGQKTSGGQTSGFPVLSYTNSVQWPTMWKSPTTRFSSDTSIRWNFVKTAPKLLGPRRLPKQILLCLMKSNILQFKNCRHHRIH